MQDKAPPPTKLKKLADQLALFDSLPDCALVAIPIVCAVKGRSSASVWRDVAAGRIAKPVRVGARSTRWRVGDLR
jgi:predicted DNA-binding transcriptional regulator AlpA